MTDDQANPTGDQAADLGHDWGSGQGDQGADMASHDRSQGVPTDLVTPPTTTAPGGPSLTLTEAVEQTGQSRSTLLRRIKAGTIVGAHHGPDGGWRLPVAGLIGAGLMLARTAPDTPVTTPVMTPVTGLVTAPVTPVTTPVTDTAEVIQLRGEVARLRAERDQAHAVAAERERNLEDLRKALAVLERALPPASTDPVTTPVTTPVTDQVTPRRRLWRRGN